MISKSAYIEEPLLVWRSLLLWRYQSKTVGMKGNKREPRFLLIHHHRFDHHDHHWTIGILMMMIKNHKTKSNKDRSNVAPKSMPTPPTRPQVIKKICTRAWTKRQTTKSWVIITFLLWLTTTAAACAMMNASDRVKAMAIEFVEELKKQTNWNKYGVVVVLSTTRFKLGVGRRQFGVDAASALLRMLNRGAKYFSNALPKSRRQEIGHTNVKLWTCFRCNLL